MASQKKTTLWVAVIGALGVILAALITSGFGLIGHQSSGNSINQNSTGGSNVACQNNSTCSGG